MSRLCVTIAGVSCVLGVLPVAAFAGTSSDLAKSTAPVSAGIFSADVRSGPDMDLALWGRLAIRVGPSGALSGAVVRAGGLRVPISGMAHGRTLTMVFHLPAGTMSGTGTASHDIRTIADLPTRGTLTGPRVGDKGDWAITEELEKGKGKHPGGTDKKVASSALVSLGQ